MDDTLDAIFERLKPQNLVDEIISWARSTPEGSDRVRKVAKNMATNVIHWIEEHPVSSLLLGGAIAACWYESRSHGRMGRLAYPSPDETMADYETGAEFSGASVWSSPANETSYGESTPGKLKEAARERVRHVRERAQDLTHRAKDTLSRVRERAGAASTRIRERGAEKVERARATWSTGRERFSGVVEERPISMGVGFLALGILAGLLAPAMPIERRSLGPMARRAREQGRNLANEALRKSKDAASAAASAAACEAEAQGFTPHDIIEKASTVAQSAAEAGIEALHSETPKKEG
jgi:hypothetical protein